MAQDPKVRKPRQRKAPYRPYGVRVTLQERRRRAIASINNREKPPTLSELCLDNAMNTIHGRPIIEQFVEEGLLERYRDEKRVWRYKLKE
jgi:hypothetical protein